MDYFFFSKIIISSELFVKNYCKTIIITLKLSFYTLKQKNKKIKNKKF